MDEIEKIKEWFKPILANWLRFNCVFNLDMYINYCDELLISETYDEDALLLGFSSGYQRLSGNTNVSVQNPSNYNS